MAPNDHLIQIQTLKAQADRHRETLFAGRPGRFLARMKKQQKRLALLSDLQYKILEMQRKAGSTNPPSTTGGAS